MARPAPAKTGHPRAARRLWSLPASRAAHAIADELQILSRAIIEGSWLLAALLIAYVALGQGDAPGPRLVHVALLALIYAAGLLAVKYFDHDPGASQWPTLMRTWLMIGFIGAVLWQLGVAGGILLTLYHLPVIASAVALGRRLTFLNLLLIALSLLVLRDVLGGASVPAAQGALALLTQLGPMVLVAYVVSRVAADIRKALARVRFISETDELTRLYNLRAFMRIAERLHRQAKRYARPYAIVMIDSDNLKAVNDNHGHECGNRLLKLTTANIRRELRETDVAARYGGDEFILLLPETTAAGGRELSERVRRSVGAKALEVRGMRVGTSVSIGVAGFPEHGNDLQSIVNKADQAMYLSKRTGRNRVTLFDPG